MGGWKLIIYGLIDPRTGHVRYVGKSSSGMKRPSRHWSKIALERGKTACDCWVRKLVLLGLLPEIEILEDLGTFHEDKDNANLLLNEAEISWISFMKHCGCDLLNHTLGGDGTFGIKRSDETKKKMSKSLVGRKPGMLNKKHSKETKSKMKIAQLRRFGRIDDNDNIIPKKKKERKDVSGKNNHFFGRTHSEKSKEKMRTAAINRDIVRWKKKISIAKSKPVVCLDDGMRFVSTKEAGKFYGIAQCCISVCARGASKSGKTHGLRFRYIDED